MRRIGEQFVWVEASSVRSVVLCDMYGTMIIENIRAFTLHSLIFFRFLFCFPPASLS